MSVSAVLITYNEKDLLPNCLNWLNTLTNLNEICIIDSFSTDGTWDIIQNFKTTKSYKIKQQVFQSFGVQKNDCMDMATSDWILLIDADETYGHQMNRLIEDINNKKPELEKINAFRFLTYLMYPDNKHYVHPTYLHLGFDPHVRLWRNDMARYVGDCHERLYDINKRDLHMCNDIDIMTLNFVQKQYPIIMLHHQLRKSKESLIDKGKRWNELDMFTKSAEQKIQVDKETWVRLQRGVNYNHHLVTNYLPKELWDFK